MQMEHSRIIMLAKDVFSKDIILAKINTIGPINLAYDGHSKIVRVEANEGTLACAGDALKVTTVDNSGK